MVKGTRAARIERQPATPQAAAVDLSRVPQHPPGDDSRRGTPTGPRPISFGTAPDLFLRARACLRTVDWRTQKVSSCVEQRRPSISAIRAHRVLELHVLSDLIVVGYDDC